MFTVAGVTNGVTSVRLDYELVRRAAATGARRVWPQLADQEHPPRFLSPVAWPGHLLSASTTCPYGAVLPLVVAVLQDP